MVDPNAQILLGVAHFAALDHQLHDAVAYLSMANRLLFRLAACCQTYDQRHVASECRGVDTPPLIKPFGGLGAATYFREWSSVRGQRRLWGWGLRMESGRWAMWAGREGNGDWGGGGVEVGWQISFF